MGLVIKLYGFTQLDCGKNLMFGKIKIEELENFFRISTDEVKMYPDSKLLGFQNFTDYMENSD